jgi:hypothetical protein
MLVPKGNDTIVLSHQLSCEDLRVLQVGICNALENELCLPAKSSEQAQWASVQLVRLLVASLASDEQLRRI